MGFGVVLTEGSEKRVVLVAAVSVDDIEFAESTEKRGCADIEGDKRNFNRRGARED